MSVRVHLKQAVHRFIDSNHYTPDLLPLQYKYDYVPIFVYGEEQFGYSDDSLMESYPRIGIGFLPTQNYTMFKTSEHQAFCLFSPEGGHLVRGEVWLVPPRVLTNIDMWHTNGIFMRRSTRTIHWYDVADREKSDRDWYSTECFVWLGVNERMKFQINNGASKPMTPITGKNINPYFHYRKGDNQPLRLHGKAL